MNPIPLEDLREVEPGVWSAIAGTRSYEVRIDVRPGGGEIMVNGRAAAVSGIDPREWNPRSRSGQGSGTAVLKAPIPGKVVRVLVRAGDAVTMGQGCVVVEAMKMQNELKSPRDGVVTAVQVREHDTVGAGAALVTIE